MKKSEGLLVKLGITCCTKRHLKIVTDCKKLLDQLGSWDENDLKITECWLNEYYSQ